MSIWFGEVLDAIGSLQWWGGDGGRMTEDLVGVLKDDLVH